jgi:hypothetical protein
MMEGSGAGSVLVTNRSGCGSERRKHTDSVADPDPQNWKERKRKNISELLRMNEKKEQS